MAGLIEAIYRFACSQAGLSARTGEAKHIAQIHRARAAPFDDRLADFLESLALAGEADDYDPHADRVTLLTLHASKGLEFPVVFIVGSPRFAPALHPAGRREMKEWMRKRNGACSTWA